jgi:hypothetical protein
LEKNKKVIKATRNKNFVGSTIGTIQHFRLACPHGGRPVPILQNFQFKHFLEACTKQIMP